AGAAQQHDVAPLAFHGKVFIQRADDCLFGQRDNCVERVVRNRATVGDGDHAAAAPGLEQAIHAIAMQVRSIPSAAGGDAVGEHGHDLFKVALRQVAIGISAAQYVEEVLLAPVIGGAAGDDLLRQNVQRSFGNHECVELAGFDGAYQGSAFDELV